MQTSKDLSNISYNTIPFLKGKLDHLFEHHIIEFWAFIKHKPEYNEDNLANRKEHIHLMFRPNKRINTMVIAKEFYEPDPESNKPLKCTDDWRIVNSFADWWLYVLHDKQYLKHKHLEREFHYSIDDFYSSDMDTLERLISFIDLSEMYRQEKMFTAAAQGMSFKKAMAAGIFGEHPQRWATMYSALLMDNAAERAEEAHKKEMQYAIALEKLRKEKT